MDKKQTLIKELDEIVELTTKQNYHYVLERKPRFGKDGDAVAKHRVARKSVTGIKCIRPTKK
jgi:hypothetical protein